jgi:hypothetical protein
MHPAGPQAFPLGDPMTAAVHFSPAMTKGKPMGVRAKLNGIYAGGAIVVAAVVGLAAGSWVAFGASLLMLLALSLQSKRIRLRRSRCRRGNH